MFGLDPSEGDNKKVTLLLFLFSFQTTYPISNDCGYI